MSSDKLRRLIAHEAALLLYVRQESDYYRAKLKAGRRLCGGWVHPRDLPHNDDVRTEIQRLICTCDPQRREELASQLPARVQRIIAPRATPSAANDAGGGDAMDDAAAKRDVWGMRFEIYESLLLPLEHVRLNPKRHPEGDALYHSLQVFDLARQHMPYDEEFLMAALLHEVGRAVDPRDPVPAALEALEGAITPRAAWFIEHQGDVGEIREGTLGVRSLRRLRQSEDFDDLKLLAECDRQGRQIGYPAPELDEALEYLEELGRLCDE